MLGGQVALGRVSVPVLRLSTLMILPATIWSWGRLNLCQKYYQEFILGGKGGRCVGLTNLTFLIYGLSGNQ